MFTNWNMNTETNNRKNYVKPATQEIQMEAESQLLYMSNYDYSETD